MRHDENNVKNNNDSHLLAGHFPALLRVNAQGAGCRGAGQTCGLRVATGHGGALVFPHGHERHERPQRWRKKPQPESRGETAPSLSQIKPGVLGAHKSLGTARRRRIRAWT
jgi:hypothetical protein